MLFSLSNMQLEFTGEFSSGDAGFVFSALLEGTGPVPFPCLCSVYLEGQWGSVAAVSSQSLTFVQMPVLSIFSNCIRPSSLSGGTGCSLPEATVQST